MQSSVAKRVLVTGAAGFIGFHTAQEFLDQGWDVLGIDNFNSYYSPELKRARAQILEQKGLQIVQGDLCDEALLKSLFGNFQPSHVLHLAAQAGVRYSLKDPQAYVKSNLEGFVHLLEVSAKAGLEKLVYASSSSVYGRNSQTPFSIKDPTNHPASLYGASKKANELIASAYHHLYGLPVVGLRFFTVYGPWGRPDMAYYSFAKKIMEGKAVDVFHNGEMWRDFTHIQDIVQGILAAFQLPAGEFIYNLGNDQPRKLGDFVGILERLLGKKAQIRYLEMQKGDVLSTHADISESKRDLGFEPKISLEDGLESFIQWFKEQNLAKNVN